MFSTIAVILCVALAAGGQSGPSDASWEGLSFEVQTEGDAYLPGQLVALKLRSVNTSHETLELKGRASVWDGRITIFVAREGEAFREYHGPGWGLHCGILLATTKLRPGEASESEAAILFHLKTQTSHLNESYARRIEEQNLTTAYAFERPGVYLIKAVLYDHRFEKKKESPAVRVNVVEPQGADLAVWSVLKQNPELGYFIQTGESPHTTDDARTAALLTKLREIQTRYPDSAYAPAVSKSLLKFDSINERVRKSKERQ